MTFDEYVFNNHIRVGALDTDKQFTLHDMQACWNASANNVGQAVVDLHDGKFHNLPHRSEDEQQ